MLDPGTVVVAGGGGQLGKPTDLLLPRVTASNGPLLVDAAAPGSAFHLVQPSIGHGSGNGTGNGSYANGAVLAAAGRMLGQAVAAEDASDGDQRLKRQRTEGSDLGASDAAQAQGIAAIAAAAATASANGSELPQQQQQQQQQPQQQSQQQQHAFQAALQPLPNGQGQGQALGTAAPMSTDWLSLAGNPQAGAQLAQLVQVQVAQSQAQAQAQAQAQVRAYAMMGAV